MVEKLLRIFEISKKKTGSFRHIGLNVEHIGLNVVHTGLNVVHIGLNVVHIGLNVVHIGLNVVQTGKEVSVDQNNYISSLKPVELSAERVSQKDEELTIEEKSKSKINK